MKGLLLKDYYLIRDGMVILLLTFVAVGAGLAFLTSPWVLIVVAGATMSFQGAMTVQSDRSTQWDRFSAVLPLPRSTVVSEKYVLYLLLCALGMALGLAVGGIAAALGRAPDPGGALSVRQHGRNRLPDDGQREPALHVCAHGGKKPGRHHPVRYLVSALFAGGIFALRQVMDVKLHMRTVLGLGAALSALCYGISWIIAARRLPMRDR